MRIAMFTNLGEASVAYGGGFVGFGAGTADILQTKENMGYPRGKEGKKRKGSRFEVSTQYPQRIIE
ncbi:hypothetical protein BPOR_0822g00060 [Botrytis porri]|uniref:Uncharacterized protein n=1 Tax=Botrytis porri TaxID=87229 RepID=A0A4Z1K9Y6_9HELO|nr:hypothetical protein BPOR_0822g00060 [Botrytis porri]